MSLVLGGHADLRRRLCNSNAETLCHYDLVAGQPLTAVLSVRRRQRLRTGPVHQSRGVQRQPTNGRAGRPLANENTYAERAEGVRTLRTPLAHLGSHLSWYSLVHILGAAL